MKSNCPYCSGESRFYLKVFGDDLHKCHLCTLIFLYPYPSQEQMVERHLSREYAEHPYFQTGEDMSEHGETPLHRLTLAALSSHISSDSRILDVGAGAGDFVRAATPWFPNVEGLEPSPHLASRARQRSGKIIIESSFESFSPDALYDAVILMDNRQGVHLYLQSRFAHGDETLFQGVFRLPEGSLLRWQRGQWNIHRYYSNPVIGGPDDERDYQDLFEKAFDNAVTSHMVADVPVGAYQYLAAIIRAMHWQPLMPPTLANFIASVAQRMPLLWVQSLSNLPLGVAVEARNRLAWMIRRLPHATIGEYYDLLLALYRPDELQNLYTPDFFKETGRFVASSFAGKPAGSTMEDQVLSLQYRKWLPANINLKQDKLAMAHSVETRVPFLDHPLVELTATGMYPRKHCGR